MWRRRRKREVVASAFSRALVYLSHIVDSTWTVVVFPTSVGFPRYIVCRLIVSVFCVFRAYILHSVVAERISESNPFKVVSERLVLEEKMDDSLGGMFKLTGSN